MRKKKVELTLKITENKWSQFSKKKVFKRLCGRKTFLKQIYTKNLDIFRSSHKSKRDQNIKSPNRSLSRTKLYSPKAMKSNNTAVVTPMNKKHDQNSRKS